MTPDNETKFVPSRVAEIYKPDKPRDAGGWLGCEVAGTLGVAGKVYVSVGL